MTVGPPDRGSPMPPADDFEARVAAHQIAVARILRLEQQAIDAMRENDGVLPDRLAQPWSRAHEEARADVWRTGADLFALGDPPASDESDAGQPGSAG